MADDGAGMRPDLSAEVTFEVRELHPGYFTYDVAIRPVDGLPRVPQASGAVRSARTAEARAALACGLIAAHLARMGAAPLPVRRIGDGPRERARRRVGYALGFGLACAVSGLILGLTIATLAWLVGSAIR